MQPEMERRNLGSVDVNVGRIKNRTNSYIWAVDGLCGFGGSKGLFPNCMSMTQRLVKNANHRVMEELIGSGTSMEGIDRRRFGSGLFFRLRFLVSLTNGNDKNAFIFYAGPW